MGKGVLEAKRDAGQKLLIPFVTAGCRPDWLDVAVAISEAGADAIEIGIPFSDPMMDGPVIQEATRVALEAGATPPGILRQVAELDLEVPIFVMTSYNICFRAGHGQFAGMLQTSGVDGAVLPDLPFDEAREWCLAGKAAGVATVLMTAPTTTDTRLDAICNASTAWVYAMARLGVTGERPNVERFCESGSPGDLKRRTGTVPVIIGMGISTILIRRLRHANMQTGWWSERVLFAAFFAVPAQEFRRGVHIRTANKDRQPLTSVPSVLSQSLH